MMAFQMDVSVETNDRINTIELFVWLGEYDRAVDLVDHMLSTPSRITINALKLSPIYDPLRDNPRFQELIEKYKEKG
jgi:hypothetical protein